MRARDAALPALLALTFSFAVAPAEAQTSGFTGRYALKITFGASCRAGVVGVTVPLSFSQSAVAAGAEIDGRPIEPSETGVAQATFLYAAAKLHGAFASVGSRAAREPISTAEGLLLSPWLMLDGTVTTGSGRPQAKGTAFGFTAVGRVGEDPPSSLASCTGSDFSWTLDPQ